MLTNSSLSAAYPLAQKLAAKGLALQPVVETPLAVLINASLSQARVVASAVEPMEPTPEFSGLLIAGSTQADPLGMVAHDQAMEEAIKLISQAVSFNLDLAKNTINPLIKQVFEGTQAYMDSQAKSSLAPMSVVPFYYHAIWDNPMTAELVNRYAELPLTDVALQPLNLAEPATFSDLVLTGVGSYDESVAKFVQDKGTTVKAVWNSVFNGGAQTLGQMVGGRYDAVDTSLLVFLFARRYMAEIPDGVNMELPQWQAYISAILAQAGRAVVRVYEKRALDIKFKNLVISAPVGAEPQGVIVVVGDVYDQWLKEGGSPEILFGAVCNNSGRGYSELLTNAESNLAAWKRTYALLQSTASFERFNSLVEGLRNSMSAAIANLPDELCAVPREVLQQRLRERLTHVKQKDLEDLYNVCRKAVCRVIFPHTDAEQVLLAIDASAAAHPQLDIREAALLATIDYVATWLCKLVVVEEARDVVG